MRRLLKSFVYAWNGFVVVWKEEANFRIELSFAFLACVLAYIFNFSYLEWAVLVLVITVVLVGEMVNTAVEDLCNKIEPKQDKSIGKIKDMMATYVLLLSVGAFVIGVILFGHHFIA